MVQFKHGGIGEAPIIPTDRDLDTDIPTTTPTPTPNDNQQEPRHSLPDLDLKAYVLELERRLTRLEIEYRRRLMVWRQAYLMIVRDIERNPPGGEPDREG